MSTTINFILSLPLVPASKSVSSEAADLKAASGNVSVYLSTESSNIPNNPQTLSSPKVSEDLTSNNRTSQFT